jgi:hypothetical protein
MAMTATSNGMGTSYIPALGPLLQPYVPDDLANILSIDIPNGPTPIVVSGHFDDPGAADCVPEAREACMKRFVLEDVLAYDPAAPTLPPALTGTPFPVDSPPVGLFPATECAGDVPYSFVGWTTADALDSTAHFDGYAWAVVTADVVPVGDWYSDPNARHRFNLPMGRRVCLGFEAFPDSIGYAIVKGTGYRIWDDGRRTTDDGFGRGSGDPKYPAAGTPPHLPPPVSVVMRGPDLAGLDVTIRDWSGKLASARSATEAELSLPGSETGNGRNSAALVIPGQPHSVLVVWAACGSDQAGTMTVTSDRQAVLLLAHRSICRQPGARRGAVLTYRDDVPTGITADSDL